MRPGKASFKKVVELVSPGHHVGADAEGGVGEHVGEVHEVLFDAEVRRADVEIPDPICQLDGASRPLAVEGAEGAGGATELPVVPVVVHQDF